MIKSKIMLASWLVRSHIIQTLEEIRGSYHQQYALGVLFLGVFQQQEEDAALMSDVGIFDDHRIIKHSNVKEARPFKLSAHIHCD